MGTQASPRGRNPRGQGDRLRAEIIAATLGLLDELGDDEALSMRAVARAVGTAATSVYLHFADRDALVLATLRHCHDDLMRAADEAAAGSDDPAEQLRARVLVLGTWSRRHPGLYRVMHESAVNRRPETAFRSEVADSTTAAVRRCMDAGVAPAGDAQLVALDLRAAVHGAVALRLSQPQLDWPPLTAQIDRFLTRLVGLPAR